MHSNANFENKMYFYKKLPYLSIPLKTFCTGLKGVVVESEPPRPCVGIPHTTTTGHVGSRSATSANLSGEKHTHYLTHCTLPTRRKRQSDFPRRSHA